MFLLFITLVPSRYCKLLSPINTPLTVADENQDNGSRGSVSSSVIGVFTEKGKLVLTDGKLSAKGQKGAKRHCSFMWIREVVSACLNLRLKTVKGSPIPPSLNALETPPPQNDDQVKTAATAAKEGFETTLSQGQRKEYAMYDDVIDLLKAHEYFRGVSDAVLGEIARIGTITNYDAAAVVHQLNDPLSSICFILRGRLKTVRVDSRGDDHLFQIFERGEQYGMMLGGLGESIPLRIFALEPSTILRLDHEKSMELVLLYPELRRQWLQSYARSLRRRFLEPTAGQAPKVLAVLHQSPATRNLAQKIIGRLQGLGEAVSVLSECRISSWVILVFS
jgi:CRP-like cAMP-binding protein